MPHSVLEIIYSLSLSLSPFCYNSRRSCTNTMCTRARLKWFCCQKGKRSYRHIRRNGIKDFGNLNALNSIRTIAFWGFWSVWCNGNVSILLYLAIWCKAAFDYMHAYCILHTLPTERQYRIIIGVSSPQYVQICSMCFWSLENGWFTMCVRFDV